MRRMLCTVLRQEECLRELWRDVVRAGSCAVEGEVRAFTIDSMAAPDCPVPFVASVIDCEGTSVRANLVNVMPDPDHVKLGMRVRLVTYTLGVDESGTEAIGFGFEPVD